MLPPSLVSLNVIVCEKILFEEDRVYSAIRMVDVFYFRRNLNLAIEEQSIAMCVLIMGKTQPDEKEEHSVQIVIRGPDGEAKPIGDPLRAVFVSILSEEGKALLAEGSKVSDIAGGFTLRADIKVVPRQTGKYQVEVLMDSILVAKTPFTILELKPAP